MAPWGFLGVSLLILLPFCLAILVWHLCSYVNAVNGMLDFELEAELGYRRLDPYQQSPSPLHLAAAAVAPAPCK